MAKGLQDLSGFDHDRFMGIALVEGEAAGKRGDKPFGAVLVHGDLVIGKSSNTLNTRRSRVHHAENWLCLEHAQYLFEHGPDCVIYATLEPCVMCLSTIIMANVRNIVIGMPDKFMNTRAFIDSNPWLKERVNNYLVGVREKECRALIESYGDEKDKAILL